MANEPGVNHIGFFELRFGPVSMPVHATFGYLFAILSSFCVLSCANAAGEPSAASLAEPPPVIAIKCGGGSVGRFSDERCYLVYSSTSKAFVTNDVIKTLAEADPASQAIYQSERAGDFVYKFSCLSPDKPYLVRLHFSENYKSQAGQRVFSVTINGTTVLNNFDVFAAAGGKDKAIVEAFTGLSTALGQIIVSYASEVGSAVASAIEIYSAPQFQIQHTECPLGAIRSFPSKYNYCLLPTPPGDLMHSGRINNNGLIVGRVLSTGVCFLWDHGHIATLDNAPTPIGINDVGQIVGGPVVSDKVGHFKFLGELQGYENVYGQDINNAGEVTGYALNLSVGNGEDPLAKQSCACLWRNLKASPLEIPFGYKASRAYSINELGQVAGWLLTNDDRTHAAVWEDGHAHDLGGFAGGSVSIATCINNAGQIVGSSQHNDGSVTAFLWQNGVMRDLGKFDGDKKSRAYYINNYGQVVGASFSGDPNNFTSSRAFLWDATNGTRDLTQLLDLDSATIAAMEGCTSANCINDNGQIAGVYRPQDKHRGMFLLTPGR